MSRTCRVEMCRYLKLPTVKLRLISWEQVTYVYNARARCWMTKHCIVIGNQTMNTSIHRDAGEGWWGWGKEGWVSNLVVYAQEKRGVNGGCGWVGGEVGILIDEVEGGGGTYIRSTCLIVYQLIHTSTLSMQEYIGISTHCYINEYIFTHTYRYCNSFCTYCSRQRRKLKN